MDARILLLYNQFNQPFMIYKLEYSFDGLRDAKKTQVQQYICIYIVILQITNFYPASNAAIVVWVDYF